MTETSERVRAGMAWIPAGSFLMGSEDFYPEEAPVRRVEVRGFWIDERPVTVAEFRRFVKATSYVTVAERPLDPTDFPDADPTALVPGSLVFRPTRGPVDLRDFRNWWAYVPGARWNRPTGPGTETHARHPVTQVAYEDAAAYAAWVGKELPTEAEWEYAARGGLEGATYAWGEEPFPGGRAMANTWQGEFPWQNLCLDGFAGTSPVGSFPPNGYGLFDMIGNVWEWTCDRVRRRHGGAALLRAGRRGRAAGDQGRLAPVRSELLPALPARGAPERDRGHVDGPHRIPLRGAVVGRSSTAGAAPLLPSATRPTPSSRHSRRRER